MGHLNVFIKGKTNNHCHNSRNRSKYKQVTSHTENKRLYTGKQMNTMGMQTNDKSGVETRPGSENKCHNKNLSTIKIKS